MPRTTITLSLLASALFLAACDDGDTKADTRDDDTTSTARETSTASGAVVSAELSAAASVRGSTVDDSGNVESDEGAESDLDAEGRFTMEVSADQELYLIETLDANGEVIGMAVVESTGSEDSETTVTPTDMESTIEASSWLALVADAQSKRTWSYADVRERISAELAASAYSDWESDGESSGDIQIIADGIAAAQEAELMAWQDASAALDLAAMWEAEHEASADLSAALDAAIASGSSSTDDAHDAHAEFSASLWAAAESSTALSAELLSEASATAWMAHAATIEASAGAEAALTEGAKIAWGEGQSTASSEVVASLLFALDTSMDGSTEGDTLQSDAYSATTLAAMAEAWASFGDTIVGDGSGDALLTSALDIDLTAQAAYYAASESCLIGSSDLYADLVAEASGSATAESMATAAVDGRADYRDSVMLAASDLEAWLGSSTSAEAAVMAMLAADGSFVSQTR